MEATVAKFEIMSPVSQFLPAAGRKKIVKPPVERGTAKSQAHPLRALVVDDVQDVAEMMALLLQYAGFEALPAHSADEALQLAKSQPFDVIVSDLGLPDKNGYELAEALRTLPNYRSIPMIAVTGYAEYDDPDRALRSGFDAHLNKPIDPDMLLSVIARLSKQ